MFVAAIFLLSCLTLQTAAGHELRIKRNHWLRVVRRNTQAVIQGEDGFGQIPEEVLAKHFEGDILPDYDGISKEYGEDLAQTLLDRGIIQPIAINKDTRVNRRWPKRVDDVVHIPYIINADAGYSGSQITLIVNALDELSFRAKVVKFVPRTTETNYIEVTSDPEQGCSSFIGNIFTGAQPLYLRVDGCVFTDIVQHEFLHALGFWHEQSRPDRDDFVRINLENVQEGQESNFEKREDSATLESPYDYGSVMHYGRFFFSSNGEETITPLDNDVVIGEADEASDEDVRQVQLLYQCISGARTISAAEANPCTTDCKCWEGAAGCGGDGKYCQVGLACVDNQCQLCQDDGECNEGNVCISNQCVCDSDQGCGPEFECLNNQCVPLGDTCSQAIFIAELGTMSGATVGASNTPLQSCGTKDKTSPEVWYRVVGTGGTMFADTSGSGYDTQLFVLEGDCTNLGCVGGNDDISGTNVQSRVEWESATGTDYFIVVHGFAEETGSFDLTLSAQEESCNFFCFLQSIISFLFCCGLFF